MKIIYLSLMFFCFPLFAKGNNIFFNDLSNLNLATERNQHLIITKFSKNNTLRLFNHDNVLHILDYNTSEDNKIKIIKLITLIDKLLIKREKLFTLSSNLSTYQLIHIILFIFKHAMQNQGKDFFKF